MKGKVKWFNDKKGFGFITGEDGKDYFVHYSAIVGPSGRKTLIEDDNVSFEPETNDKGLAAKNVKKE